MPICGVGHTHEGRNADVARALARATAHTIETNAAAALIAFDELNFA